MGSPPANGSSVAGPPALRRVRWGGWVGPLLWMGVGAGALHLWNSRTAFFGQSTAGSTSTVELEERPQGLFCLRPEKLPKAAILSIVDGDTAQILWEDQPTYLRYYGVNTMERGHPCYEEARARNRDLSGAAVRLAFDDRKRDAYGRLLAYVFTDTGLSLDGQLVAEGLGKAWRRDGRFRGRLVALENRAREGEIGCLWSGSAPAAPKKSTRRSRKRS